MKILLGQIDQNFDGLLHLHQVGKSQRQHRLVNLFFRYLVRKLPDHHSREECDPVFEVLKHFQVILFDVEGLGGTGPHALAAINAT